MDKHPTTEANADAETLKPLVAALAAGDVSGASDMLRLSSIAYLREQVSESAERLIAFLDAMDGDPDLEDEPDLEEGGDTELNGDELDYSQSEDDGPSWAHGSRSALQASVGRPSEITYLDMDKAGNVSFLLNGQRWVGGRLNPS